jgi:glycosyltransferase involved in cell wall biosynthesis
MKIVLVHNYYQQPGGEDAVFAAEAQLLESHGDQVIRYTAHNDQVAAHSMVALASATVWNRRVYREIRQLLRRERPDMVHVHNTLPLISPAVYYAARAERVPVVQTLHNYRLLCPNALLFRDGRICEDCVGKRVPYPAVVHACYRGSRAASAAVAAMLAAHRALGTWTEQVNLFIALTEFAKRKHVDGGLRAEMISVKPNFVDPDPGVGSGDGGYALFLGRLSPEKGINTLLAAWRELGSVMPLKVVGDGPLACDVSAAAAASDRIEWLGHRTPEEITPLLARARFLVCPSECYETFGRVVIEAFAAGLPVIATDVGSVGSLVKHGSTGLHFRSGDAMALASTVAWACAHPGEMQAMRRQSRGEYEARYTADRNYTMLMDAYQSATAHAISRAS